MSFPRADAPDGFLSLAELTPSADGFGVRVASPRSLLSTRAAQDLMRLPMPSPRPMMGELAGGGAASRPRCRSKVGGAYRLGVVELA